MKELPFAGMLRRVAVFAAAGALLVSCTKEYDGFPSAGMSCDSVSRSRERRTLNVR